MSECADSNENRRSCRDSCQDSGACWSLAGLLGTLLVLGWFGGDSEGTICDSVISMKDMPGLASLGGGIVRLCNGDCDTFAARSYRSLRSCG